VPRTTTSNANTSAKSRTSRSTRQQPDSATDRQTESGNGAASATAASKTSHNPSYDEIAEAAYQRYLRRGGHDGRDFDDWLEAERELKERRQS
jgi:hypothetical protein